MKRATATVGLLALLGSALALIAIEFARGARGYGDLASRPACSAEVDYPGEGLDASIQRIAISGLYGAACELDATREELVLSFVPSVAPKEIRWDPETIERAVRAGLLRAIDDAERRGSVGDLTAAVLRRVVELAPLGWLLDRAGDLGDLLDGG